jgi:hypothetical protein
VVGGHVFAAGIRQPPFFFGDPSTPDPSEGRIVAAVLECGCRVIKPASGQSPKHASKPGLSCDRRPRGPVRHQINGDERKRRRTKVAGEDPAIRVAQHVPRSLSVGGLDRSRPPEHQIRFDRAGHVADPRGLIRSAGLVHVSDRFESLRAEQLDIGGAGLQCGRGVKLTEGLIQPASAAIHHPQLEVTLERAFPALTVPRRVNLRLKLVDLAIPPGEGGDHAIARDRQVPACGREILDDSQKGGLLRLDRTRSPHEPREKRQHGQRNRLQIHRPIGWILRDRFGASASVWPCNQVWTVLTGLPAGCIPSVRFANSVSRCEEGRV